MADDAIINSQGAEDLVLEKVVPAWQYICVWNQGRYNDGFKRRVVLSRKSRATSAPDYNGGTGHFL